MSDDPTHPIGDSTSDEEVPNLNPDLPSQTNSRPPRLRPVEEYVSGILEGDRVILSQAITLLESSRPDHRERAEAIIDECLPQTGDSVRVAVTGIPGVGKSTFIETLGQHLIGDGHRLAVLAIDPSSERSRGSILGDKTRMADLASLDDVYIRPSPNSGHLGGVARRTRETILLCEAAGFDTVFVETVGVGQSEVSVRSMVDVFLLLALPGAGDQLQGIKRGIVEMADVIAINKADGDSRSAAEDARADYERALGLLGERESGWTVPVHTCSAVTGHGIVGVWDAIQECCAHARQTGFFDRQRRRQAQHWMYQTIEELLREDLFGTPAVASARAPLETKVRRGELSSVAAARELLSIYRTSLSDSGSG